MRRAVIVAGRVLAALVAALLAALVAVGLATAGAGDLRLFPPPAGASTVEVAIVDHGYHAGLVVRTADLSRLAAAGEPVLAALQARFAAYPWLEIGWGDGAFYRLAPALSDVTVEMAIAALSGSNEDSVLHVVGLEAEPARSFPASDVQTVRLSADGFRALGRRLAVTFARDAAGQPEVIGPGLYGPSLFFRAEGRYSLLETCNHWVAGLVAAAGLKISPVPATLSGGLLAELRWRNPL
jgi:uncharacterized protein (TIGR02117 family)